jgi:cytochrome c oxidase subunit 4
LAAFAPLDPPRKNFLVEGNEMSYAEQSVVAHHADRSGHGGMAHVMPVPVLLGVFLTLIGLTVLTVAVTWHDFGSWNLLIALAIATVKAALVALYFMHLRYDQPFNGLIFVVALVFLGLFMSLTLLDTQQYQADVAAYQQQNDVAPAPAGGK